MLTQTRPPDEVHVFDDRSSDQTLLLLRDFRQRAGFPVHIYSNPERMGSIRNFEQAIRACTGDLIALSDQDDVWHPDRLSLSEKALDGNPSTGAVFTDGNLIDEQGRHLGIRLWQRFVFSVGDQQRIRNGDYIPLARFRFITGATLVFRAKYRPWIFDTGYGWHHDGWISAIIAALSDLCWIQEPLIDYRTHAGQQLGAAGHLVPGADYSTFRGRSHAHWAAFAPLLPQLDAICDALDRLPLTAAQRTVGAAGAFYVQRAFLTTRLGLPVHRWQRIRPILQAHASYRRSAMGWLSMAKDLTMAKSGNELQLSRRAMLEDVTRPRSTRLHTT